MSIKLSWFGQFILILVFMVILLHFVNQYQKHSSVQSLDSMALIVASPTNDHLQYLARQNEINIDEPDELAVLLFKVSYTTPNRLN